MTGAHEAPSASVEPLEPHYTSAACAEYIGGTTGALRNMRISGKGPKWIRTADGTIRYPASAIREWLNGDPGFKKAKPGKRGRPRGSKNRPKPDEAA